MATVSSAPEKANQWETICFPVESVQLTDLLPDYAVASSDRQKLVIGEPGGQRTIYAVQSNEYTIVPNSLLRDTITDLIPDHRLDVRYLPSGEFAINVIVDGQQFAIGSERDTLSRTLIFNNSYSGKTPFRMQGTIMHTHTEQRERTRARVSYYRLVCSNGLMGWVDEFMSVSDYFNWIAQEGHKKAGVKVKDHGISTEKWEETQTEQKQILNKKFSHRNLNLDHFVHYLRQDITAFLTQRDSLTLKVYERLARKQLSFDEVKTAISATGIPKMLARDAMSQLRKESAELQTEPNLWLTYNAVNYVLFNSRASLSMSDRYRADQSAFHELAVFAN